MKTLFTLCFLMVIPPGLHAQALKPQDQAPTVELEIEFFHDCTPGDEGLVCKIPEEAATPTALKSLDQFQKPVSVGWIPALGVFIVVDQESEVTVGKAATSALPSPKPIAFYKLNTDKTALLPTDVQTEIKNVQSQVTTAAITPGQMNFQVQYQLGQNAEQNKKNTDLSILQTQVADALPHDELPLLIPKGSLRDKEGSGKVDRQPQIVVSYDYDAINRMVGRQTQDGADTTSTQWAYFDLMRTVEYNNNRALSQLEFFHGTNGIDYLIPKSARDQTGQIPPAKGLALHKDKLGSTVMVTNEERGEVEEQIFFTPNGEVVVRNHGVDYPVSKTGNPILFTGQYYDAAVALYLFPYRAMDADQGRFLQRDPIGVADGPNTYTYANNSPFNFTDPLGLAKKSASEVKLHIILGPGHDDEGIMFAAAADTLMNRAMEAGVEGTIEHPVTGQDFADIINAIGKSGGNKTKLIVILAHSGPRLEGIQSAGLFLFQNQGYYPYGYEKSEPGSATLADLNAGALQNCVVFVAGCNSAVGGAQSLAMSFMDPKLEAHRVIGTGGTAGFVTAGGREIPKEKFGQTLQSGADVYMAAPGLAAFGRGANGDIVARVRPNNVLASEIINLTMNMIRSLGATPQNGSPRHGRAHPGRSRGASDT